MKLKIVRYLRGLKFQELQEGIAQANADSRGSSPYLGSPNGSKINEFDNQVRNVKIVNQLQKKVGIVKNVNQLDNQVRIVKIVNKLQNKVRIVKAN